MVRVIHGASKGYKPPSCEKLCIILMYKEKAHVEEDAVPMKYVWTIDGCLIVMDGWTDVHNCPLLNIIVSSMLGPYF